MITGVNHTNNLNKYKCVNAFLHSSKSPAKFSTSDQFYWMLLTNWPVCTIYKFETIFWYEEMFSIYLSVPLFMKKTVCKFCPLLHFVEVSSILSPLLFYKMPSSAQNWNSRIKLFQFFGQYQSFLSKWKMDTYFNQILCSVWNIFLQQTSFLYDKMFNSEIPINPKSNRCNDCLNCWFLWYQTINVRSWNCSLPKSFQIAFSDKCEGNEITETGFSF